MANKLQRFKNKVSQQGIDGNRTNLEIMTAIKKEEDLMSKYNDEGTIKHGIRYKTPRAKLTKSTVPRLTTQFDTKTPKMNSIKVWNNNDLSNTDLNLNLKPVGHHSKSSSIF